MKRKLTQEQQDVLATLRARGADWTAAATERAWRNGERYYMDDRNTARRGIMRQFERGNKQAKGQP